MRQRVLFLAIASAACGGPDEHARARSLYRAQGCATCHGERGEGLPSAPPLRGLAEHWDRERLAAYLRNPRDFVAQDERLAALRARYTIEMPASALTQEERLVLADFVLGLR
jgi:cytochrome c553